MRRPLNAVLTLTSILCAAILLSGCITIPDGLHPAHNANFRSHVEAAVLQGSTEEAAIAAMTASGYRCKVDPASSGFSGSRNKLDRVVTCASHGHIVGQFFERDWIASFLIENGRVAQIATITDLDAL